MTWPRPVPTIGDVSAASERAGNPQGWAFGAAEQVALSQVMAARRDVRRFRPDPVPAELLQAIVQAGHQGPSVGHSQPWRFITVTDRLVRTRAAHLADAERIRQAAGLDPERAARLLDLQLEGIREAPIGLIVACDRRANAAGVLGRATYTDADMWSCACAIQNMWLTARAHGLGMGWVTLFQPADLAELVGLPDQVESLGWLCVGWPDERQPRPGLERAGWSQTVPLDQVVIAERWPQTDQPEPPLSFLAAPDRRAVVAVRDEADRLLSAPGSLGVLDVAVNRVAALGEPVPSTGTLVLVAGDHPVTALGVSAYPATVTAEVFEATLQGVSLGAVAARAAGLAVSARYAKALDPQGDLASADALSSADVRRLFGEGRDLGRDAGSGGVVCLGEVGIGNTTVAAALTSALLGASPEVSVGLGVGADSAMVARKREVVAAALQRVCGSSDRAFDGDPLALLAALGGPEFAMLAGVATGAAEVHAPVVLDGLATSVAALIAVRMDAGVQAHLVAGQRSRERAHELVLAALGLEALLDLRLRAGEGVGACMAAQLLFNALSVRSGAARVDH